MGLNEKKNRIFVFFILLLGGMLIFINLSNMYLWQDEASVAFLGRNVLKFGYPLIYDGKNVATNSPIDRLDYDYKHAYINTQTWLEYYVVAFSFLLFGVNTFAARFPFALFGLGTIIISYLLFLKINSNKTIARISVILLIFSVPFLLHVRQVNYYALSIFLASGFFMPM